MTSEAEQNTMQNQMNTVVTLPVLTLKKRKNRITRILGRTKDWDRKIWLRRLTIQVLSTHSTPKDREIWLETEMARDRESTLTSASAAHHWQANASVKKIATKVLREGTLESEVAREQLPKTHQDSTIRNTCLLHRIWTSLTTSRVGAMKNKLVTEAHTTEANPKEDTPLRMWTRLRTIQLQAIAMPAAYSQEKVSLVEAESTVEVHHLLRARPHTTKHPNPKLARST